MPSRYPHYYKFAMLLGFVLLSPTYRMGHPLCSGHVSAFSAFIIIRINYGTLLQFAFTMRRAVDADIARFGCVDAQGGEFSAPDAAGVQGVNIVRRLSTQC